jgi:hypothetical protein
MVFRGCRESPRARQDISEMLLLGDQATAPDESNLRSSMANSHREVGLVVASC